jgi:hypothetical protein
MARSDGVPAVRWKCPSRAPGQEKPQLPVGVRDVPGQVRTRIPHCDASPAVMTLVGWGTAVMNAPLAVAAAAVGVPCRGFRKSDFRIALGLCLQDEVERRFGGAANACEASLLEDLGEPCLAGLRS